MTDAQKTPSTTDADEIDLREVILALWHGKWLISAIAIAAAVVAVIVALLLPNIYRAEALLAPNNREGASPLYALASQYGGLASLAGINLGSGSANDTTLSIEILRSRRFVADFIERRGILVPLMATTGWDTETGELIIDPSLYDVATSTWVRAASPPKKSIPSSQEAYKAFTSAFSVHEDKKSGLVTLSVEHYSPTVAKQWVDWLVDDINSTIMRRDVEQAEQAIKYLNAQVNSTSLAELQNVFFRLIEEQTKTVMLAKVSPEYMFRTLDPAVVPELKAKPRRALIVILSTILGGMIGVIVLALKNSLVPRRK